MKFIPPNSLNQITLTTGLVLTAAASHAAVVVTLDGGSAATTVSPNPNTNTLSFDLTTGLFTSNASTANQQFQINYDGTNGATTKPRLQGINGTSGAVLATGTSQASGNKVVNNAPGTTISAASGSTDTTVRSFYNGSVGVPYLSFTEDNTSQFIRGQLGYVALRINDPVVAGQIDYGYAAVTLGQDYSVTVSRLAYENTGAPITIVPEPSTYATSLLALGGAATALVARRRRAAKHVAA